MRQSPSNIITGRFTSLRAMQGGVQEMTRPMLNPIKCATCGKPIKKKESFVQRRFTPFAEGSPSEIVDIFHYTKECYTQYPLGDNTTKITVEGIDKEK